MASHVLKLVVLKGLLSDSNISLLDVEIEILLICQCSLTWNTYRQYNRDIVFQINYLTFRFVAFIKRSI